MLLYHLPDNFLSLDTDYRSIHQAHLASICCSSIYTFYFLYLTPRSIIMGYHHHHYTILTHCSAPQMGGHIFSRCTRHPSPVQHLRPGMCPLVCIAPDLAPDQAFPYFCGSMERFRPKTPLSPISVFCTFGRPSIFPSFPSCPYQNFFFLDTSSREKHFEVTSFFLRGCVIQNRTCCYIHS